MDVSVNSQEDDPYFDDLRKHASHVRGGPVSDEEIIAMISAIDPKTCEATWWSAQVMDPYSVAGVDPEMSCIGREYFARAPGTDVWVALISLPKRLREAIWESIDSKLEALVTTGISGSIRSPKAQNLFPRPVTPAGRLVN